MADRDPERLAGGGGRRAPHVLGPRAARTWHNAADALRPAHPVPCGAGDPNLLPRVERRLRWEGPGAVRRFTLLLALLEWQPRLALRSRRGFSHLPRDARAATLARLERSRLRPLRRAAAALRRRVETAWEEAGREAAAGQSEGA